MLSVGCVVVQTLPFSPVFSPQTCQGWVTGFCSQNDIIFYGTVSVNLQQTYTCSCNPIHSNKLLCCVSFASSIKYFSILLQAEIEEESKAVQNVKRKKLHHHEDRVQGSCMSLTFYHFLKWVYSWQVSPCLDIAKTAYSWVHLSCDC